MSCYTYCEYVGCGKAIPKGGIYCSDHNAGPMTYGSNMNPLGLKSPPISGGVDLSYFGTKLGDAIKDAAAEVKSAKDNWPEFNSAHEGFAILEEEFDELKVHVWTNQKKRDLSKMRKEAIQVAAMALRFASEVCDEERGRR